MSPAKWCLSWSGRISVGRKGSKQNIKETLTHILRRLLVMWVIMTVVVEGGGGQVIYNEIRLWIERCYLSEQSRYRLQASVDHHGYSINSGHYTASINCCGKTFHYNDNKITECIITGTYNLSTAYILLYKLMGGNMSRRAFVVAGIVECQQPDHDIGRNM